MEIVATGNGSPSINWEELDKTRKEIKGFLKSLNARVIGTGLVIYKKEEFKLIPRSDYINNHTYQWFASIGTEGASFGATQEGFISLKAKVECLIEKIKFFKPESVRECPLQAAQFLKGMVEIQNIITNIASQGLNQLCFNYEMKNKIKQSTSLKTLGEDSFKQIIELKDSLVLKLLSHLPHLQNDLDLNRCSMVAGKILHKRGIYVEHLRSIMWDAVQGVIIPELLIKDCRKDICRISELTKHDIRNAANLIHLPSQVRSIPAQMKGVEWLPLRPISGEKVIFEEGITGGCERDGFSSPNLCNVFYRLDRAGYLTISAGEVESFEKGLQFLAVLRQAQNSDSKPRLRWVLHQLNSFYNETDSIYSTNRQMAFVEGFLNINKNESELTSILHINTSFNAASTFSNEDSQSLNDINIENLALLVSYAFTDVLFLLANQSETKTLAVTARSKCSSLPVMIKGFKQVKWDIWKLLFPKETEILRQHAQEDDLSEQQPEFPNQDSIDEKLKTFKSSLGAKQKEFEQYLPLLIPEIRNFINALNLKVPSEHNPLLEKSILIFEVLELVLALQFKQPLPSLSLSRCSEIELFLLLYRLLDINVIINCSNGLDRAGTVVAIQDSMSQLEEVFFNECLVKIKDKSENDPLIARVQGQKMMFRFIKNLNHYRESLFQITDAFIIENSISVTQDFSPMKVTNRKSFDFRGTLFNKIRSPDSQIINDPDTNPEDLIDAQYYFEIVAAHLLSTQSEKTLFSTGVIGLKYHYDISWIKKKVAANPHPLERLPMFISDDSGNIIQLLKYEKGWVSNGVAITDIGISLFMRLSQLRGK